MWIRTSALLALVSLATTPAFAQAPLSAIDWLSDSLAEPPAHIELPKNGDIPKSALPEHVSVSELGETLPDAAGLLPSHTTGLPVDLWGKSRSRDIAGRFPTNHENMYPAMLDLLMNVLLAELEPPLDSDASGVLLIARLDALLALGALEEANALLNLSNHYGPELFRRVFDISLLLGHENDACITLRNTPELSPTFPARIFCLARGGDWDAAALSLETGRALGFLSDFEDALLARFLEPEIATDQPRLFVPPSPSPLVYRLLEAIGEPISTSSLPRAYAHADLHANNGWKAQLRAAERLVQTRGIGVNRLEGLYFHKKAAASGGVWERVRAVQALDDALKNGDKSDVELSLSRVWEVVSAAGLEMPLSAMFSDRLIGLDLAGKAGDTAVKIGLLSERYEDFANLMLPASPKEILLQAIATGRVENIQSTDAVGNAVLDGFHNRSVPVRLQSLVNDDRLGEAILRAMVLFHSGAQGDLDELSDALSFFRAIGMEDTARRAALQLLILGSR